MPSNLPSTVDGISGIMPVVCKTVSVCFVLWQHTKSCSHLVNLSEHIRARGGLFFFGLVFLSSVPLIFIIIIISSPTG